jgi:copper homeostasis protein
MATRPSGLVVEACCDSVATARAAQAHGATRVELCGPGDGGTTPSLGLLVQVRALLRIPLFVMVRPRAGDFVYDADELEVMANDVVTARVLGADGVVMGPLRPDGTVDARALATLVTLARPLRVTFHRAFDRTPDPDAALEALLAQQVDGVLTSGHAPTALAGAPRLRAWQARAGDRLEVMAGGGVRADHARTLVDTGGLRALHARGTDPAIIRDLVQALA